MAHQVDHHGNKCLFIPFLNGPLFCGPDSGTHVGGELKDYTEGTPYNNLAYPLYILANINGNIGWKWTGPIPQPLPQKLQKFMKQVENSGMSEYEIEQLWREQSASQ